MSDGREQGLAAATTAWCDQWWDDDRALLWNPPGSFDEHGLAPLTWHMVPQTAWYVVGLLGRGEPRDVDRATRALHALCDLQYDEPGTPWHGTFARFAETPPPADGAVMWVHFDPNWRQFLGTTFSVVLADLAGALDAATTERLAAAVDLAVRGEPADRVPPSYSNIALMRAWLEVEAGRPGAEAYAQEVVALFERHGAFAEYGSPTYYGIDLFALALWRERSSSAALRQAGARIEAALWRDIARWYHPGLRNLCGPYSRAYGMDMATSVGLLGLHLWQGLGVEHAAVPDLDAPFQHSHDLSMGPVIERTGATIPSDAVGALERFGGERLVRQQITDDRVATGWLADDVMFGAEAGGRYRAEGQHMPVTVHWRARDGSTAWLRLTHRGPLDAVVPEPGVIEVRHDGGDPTVVASAPFPGTIEHPADDRLTIRWR